MSSSSSRILNYNLDSLDENWDGNTLPEDSAKFKEIKQHKNMKIVSRIPFLYIITINFYIFCI